MPMTRNTWVQYLDLDDCPRVPAPWGTHTRRCRIADRKFPKLRCVPTYLKGAGHNDALGLRRNSFSSRRQTEIGANSGLTEGPGGANPASSGPAWTGTSFATASNATWDGCLRRQSLFIHVVLSELLLVSQQPLQPALVAGACLPVAAVIMPQKYLPRAEVPPSNLQIRASPLRKQVQLLSAYVHRDKPKRWRHGS